MQIPLREHTTREGVSLTGFQRDQLRRLTNTVAVVPTIGAESRYDLRPGSSVGVIHLEGGLELVIQPKLPISRVLFLVSYALDRARWADAPAAVDEADDVLEAVIAGFAHQLNRTLRRGVLQGYRTEDDALTTVRGRWRIGDQIRTRYGIAPPVEVTYDDFSEDIEHNRLLRAALYRLLALPIRSDRSRWPLRALDTRLANVRLVDYDRRRVPDVAFDRRSEHYRGAVGLARLILRDVSFDVAPGAVAASAFLIDMNRVFEDFVVVALRDALGVSDKVLVQGSRGRPMHLDVGEVVGLEPDITYWAGDRCVFVADAKYKRTVSIDYPNADLYQLLAYTVATRLASGLLVYAAGEAPEAVHEVRHLGKRLVVASLDLGVAPGAILRQVDALARRITAVAHAA